MERLNLCQNCKKGVENTCKYFSETPLAKVVDCGMFVPLPGSNMLEIATKCLQDRNIKK